MLGARFFLTVSHKYLYPLRGTLLSVLEVDVAPFLQEAKLLTPNKSSARPRVPEALQQGAPFWPRLRWHPATWDAVAFPRRVGG